MRRVKQGPSPTNCVYILECRGQYKIGRTSNLQERIKSLQIGNPFPMKVDDILVMGKKPEKPAVVYSPPVDPNQSSFGWD